MNLPDSIVPEGRGSRVSIGGIEIIDDSYNANPTSMAAALNGLANERARRTVAILGEMRELGDGSERFHRELAPHCARITQIVCVGEGMRAAVGRIAGAAALDAGRCGADLPLSQLAAGLQPGDVVLVKGSNRVFWVNDFVQNLTDELVKRSMP